MASSLCRAPRASSVAAIFILSRTIPLVTQEEEDLQDGVAECGKQYPVGETHPEEG
jgi:hypothetical protein